ncbi:hypothetical protein [Longimicrobium sp.]|jgi:hypothetical protein|uniref:hypothetical protein n=1 Tax=Longimicrobium sp. TaxID=2029185 RepID=UPI002ED98E62
MTQTRHPLAAKIFVMDTAKHEMTVLHDDGLYRHLTFRRPDTGLYWFDLITWPGSLCFNGDMGTYVFSRVEDMTTFFGRPGQDINPGYWGEKVKAGDIRAYEPDLARQHVIEHFREWADEHGWVLAATRDLWDDICHEILDGEVEEDEGTFRSAVDRFEWQGHADRFRFSDAWEWDLRGFKHHFLWSCFAVQWGVNRYRAALRHDEGPVPVPALPPVPREPAVSAPSPTPVPAKPRRQITVSAKETFL